MIPVIAVLVATLFIWEALIFYRRKASLPPSPFAVPLLGNFINEVKLPYLDDALKRLYNRFGSIFTVYLPYPVVNIVDYETMKDAFRGNDVTGRNYDVLGKAADMIDNGGIVASEGPEWQEQRRFAIATLRDFGMGKNLMEEKIRISARTMVDYISKQNLAQVDLQQPIQLFVSNIINEFLFGVQYTHEDCQRLTNFVKGLNQAFVSVASSEIVNTAFVFPWIVKLPIISHFYARHKRLFQNTYDYIRESIAAVEKGNQSEEPTSYVQAFRRSSKDKREGQLISCCADLFIAGQETTTTTLRWAMVLLAGHPDVQEKLRAEVHTHIGRDRFAAMADKTKMPYMSAVIHEIQRVANIIAPNPVLFHKTTVDTVIAGYKVPANTIVNGDIHQMMHSDPHFEQPERFWPERYIAEDGFTLKKELVDRTIPFGIGKRQCAGEGMARVEMFIGLCALFQNFRILPMSGKKIDFTPIYSTVRLPTPQNFRIEKI